MTQLCKCKKCGYEWKARKENPETCANPNCRSTNWNLREEPKELLPRALPNITEIPAEQPVNHVPVIEKKLSLKERMMVTGKWEPQPMWDMEKDLIARFHSGERDDLQWIADFKEWFVQAFKIAIDMGNICIIDRGGYWRPTIKENFRKRWNSGYSIDILVDTICDDLILEEEKAKNATPVK